MMSKASLEEHRVLCGQKGLNRLVFTLSLSLEALCSGVAALGPEQRCLAGLAKRCMSKAVAQSKENARAAGSGVTRGGEGPLLRIGCPWPGAALPGGSHHARLGQNRHGAKEPHVLLAQASRGAAKALCPRLAALGPEQRFLEGQTRDICNARDTRQ